MYPSSHKDSEKLTMNTIYVCFLNSSEIQHCCLLISFLLLRKTLCESWVSIYLVLHWVESGTFAWDLQEVYIDWEPFLWENEVDLTFACLEERVSSQVPQSLGCVVAVLLPVTWPSRTVFFFTEYHDFKELCGLIQEKSKFRWL